MNSESYEQVAIINYKMMLTHLLSSKGMKKLYFFLFLIYVCRKDEVCNVPYKVIISEAKIFVARPMYLYL